jgi:hypothetical protein
MKSDCEKASDADWLLAGRREDALKTLLPDTSPTAVA